MAGLEIMVIAASIGAAGALGSSLIQSNAATEASQAQVALGQQALSQQKQFLSPYVNAGQSVLDTLKSLITPGPNQTATLSQTPGFQFAQDWGLKAVQNLGSSRGLGGNVLTSGAQFASGLASNTWQNVVQALQGLVNTGANAASGGAKTIGDTLTGIGGARASGILGSANALAGGIQGVGNSLTTAMLLKNLSSGGGGGIYQGVSFPDSAYQPGANWAGMQGGNPFPNPAADLWG